MAAAAREMELKVELSDEAFAALAGTPRLAAPSPDGAPAERLHAYYFDTRDHRLWQAGLSLRVRQEPGGWVQTLKLGKSMKLGVSNPVEAEWPLASAHPKLDLVTEEPLKDALVRALGTRYLRRTFETVVMRAAHDLAVPHGRVEIALDHGQVHAERGEEVVREVEIELKAGEPVAVLEAAEALLADVPFTLSTESKAERGYRLIAGTPRPTLKDRVDPDAFPAGLSADTPAREALAAIGWAYGGAALAFRDAIPRSPDPEGPHQLRVFLRRLRTVLKAFRPALDGTRMRRIAADARDLARVAGTLRDADVLVDEIVPREPVKGADAAALADLSARLAADRDGIREQVVADVAGGRWSWLALQLALFPLAVEKAAAEAGETEDATTFGAVGGRALARAFKACNRWGKRIETLTVEERHELRKELKGLRYTIEAFRPLYPPEEVAAFLKQLKRMQDVFGYLNDVETARSVLDPAAHAGIAGGPAAAAAEAVVAWHLRRSEKAWKTARKRWKALKATPRFWEAGPGAAPVPDGATAPA